MILYLLTEKPQLPDNFQDKYLEKDGKTPPSKAVETHLKCELIKKVWEILYVLHDNNFAAAYEFGMVCDSADDHVRRHFPHFFIHIQWIIHVCISSKVFT